MTKLSSVSSATIANGASLSGAVYVGNRRLIGIQMPAAWTAAVLTFQVSPAFTVPPGVMVVFHWDADVSVLPAGAVVATVYAVSRLTVTVPSLALGS